MSAHTPGPWAAGEQSGGDWLIQSNIESHLPPWAVQNDTIGAVRANDNAEANARLIVAAPELLAALKAVVEWLPDPRPHRLTDSDGLNSVEQQARAAIAKAEGH